MVPQSVNVPPDPQHPHRDGRRRHRVQRGAHPRPHPRLLSLRSTPPLLRLSFCRPQSLRARLRLPLRSRRTRTRTRTRARGHRGGGGGGGGGRGRSGGVRGCARGGRGGAVVPARLEDERDDEAEDDQEEEEDALAPPRVLLIPAPRASRVSDGVPRRPRRSKREARNTKRREGREE